MEAASGVQQSLAAAEKGDQGCRTRSSTRGYIKLRAQKTPCKPPHLNSRFSYVSLLGLGYARSPPRISTSARGSTIAPGRLAAES